MTCSTCHTLSGGHHTGCPEDDVPTSYITCEFHPELRTAGDACAVCMAKDLWSDVCSDDLAKAFADWVDYKVMDDFQNNVEMIALMEGMPGYTLRMFWRESCPEAAKVTLLVSVCMDCEKYLGVNELEGGLATDDPYGVSHGLCDDCMRNH